jgi:hypothetical protein
LNRAREGRRGVFQQAGIFPEVRGISLQSQCAGPVPWPHYQCAVPMEDALKEDIEVAGEGSEIGIG